MTPQQAADFWKRTGLDSLAVAIGTSHGAFKFKHEAKLAFNRIEQIMKTCPGLPLVMHGSSSVPQEFIDLVNKYGGANAVADLQNAAGGYKYYSAIALAQLPDAVVGYRIAQVPYSTVGYRVAVARAYGAYAYYPGMRRAWIVSR